MILSGQIISAATKERNNNLKIIIIPEELIYYAAQTCTVSNNPGRYAYRVLPKVTP